MRLQSVSLAVTCQLRSYMMAQLLLVHFAVNSIHLTSLTVSSAAACQLTRNFALPSDPIRHLSCILCAQLHHVA